MKIKKHGSKYETKPNVESFECENCGCEFTVKEGEYYRDYSGAENSSDYYTVRSITISYTTKDYLVCSCPECHKIVKKIVERKVNSYQPLTTWTTTLKNDTNTTVTGDVKDYTISSSTTGDIKE